MGTKNINTDIEGIIRELNLSDSEILYPLFEAVVNSIQSIHEKYGNDSKEQGKISVFIERNKKEPTLFETEGNFPIQSIRIVDNGIGFNKSNYESFFKSHSTKKANIGGKGVGRFTMLSVFDLMQVNSIYKDTKEDSSFNIRTFNLSREKGVSENEPIISKAQKGGTEIILSDINLKFKKISAKYSQENIADNILEHCLLSYSKIG